MRLISFAKAERRKIIELCRLYQTDSYRRSRPVIWFLYLLNYFISYSYFSIARLKFRPLHELETVFTGFVDPSLLKLSDLSYGEGQALRYSISPGEYPNLFAVKFNSEYNKQAPETREFDSRLVSSWIHENLGEIIRAMLHSNYQIAQLRVYKTVCLGGAETFNLNSRYHGDADFPGSLKLILYLSDVDMESGPFSYEDPVTFRKHFLIGRSGTYALFKRYLIHAGSNTKSSPRYAVSALVYPSIFGGKECSDNLNLRPPNTFHYKNPFASFSHQL